MQKYRSCVWALVALLFTAAAYGNPFVPGESAADQTLVSDVTSTIMIMEKAWGKGCNQQKVVDTKIIELWADHRHSKVERWTIDRCGTKVDYQVKFTPVPTGGTSLNIHLESVHSN